MDDTTGFSRIHGKTRVFGQYGITDPEPVGEVRKVSEKSPKASKSESESDTSRVAQLEKQVFDLQITILLGKDYLIERLEGVTTSSINCCKPAAGWGN